MNEKLYNWVEKYLATYSVLDAGAVVGESERKNMSEQISSIMPEKSIASSKSIWRLTEVLPGLKPTIGDVFDDKNGEIIFNIDKKEIAKFSDKKRLGSPYHYRLYFSFAQPSGTLNDEKFEEILVKAENEEDLTTIFSELVNNKRPQGGTMYEVLIDRLRQKNLSTKAVKSIVCAISKTVDEAYKLEPSKGFFGRQTLKLHTSLILKGVLEKITDQQERKDFLNELFKKGTSLSWLLALAEPLLLVGINKTKTSYIIEKTLFLAFKETDINDIKFDRKEYCLGQDAIYRKIKNITF